MPTRVADVHSGAMARHKAQNPRMDAEAIACGDDALLVAPGLDVMTHVIVLPGGGYAEHAAHEGEPIVEWLRGLGFEASVFRYPLRVRHPVPLHALQAEIRQAATRRGHPGGSGRVLCRAATSLAWRR